MEEDSLEAIKEKYTSLDTLQEDVGVDDVNFSSQNIGDLPTDLPTDDDIISGQPSILGTVAAFDATQFTEESQPLQDALGEEESAYGVNSLKKVLKGQDILWSKSCEEDDALTKPIGQSPSASPVSDLLEQHLSTAQSEGGIYGPVPDVEKSKSLDTGYSRFPGFALFTQKRGRGRPRKNPFAPVVERPSRGRGSGRRGRPPLFAQFTHRQPWQRSISLPGSMESTTSDPTETDDGGLGSHLLGSLEGASLPGCSSDNAVAGPPATDETSSEAPSVGHVCALCNCGEKSLLGQGEMYRFEPTRGFNPFKRVLKSRRGSSESEDQSREKSPKHLTWRRPRGPLKGSRERSRSPRSHSMGEEESGDGSQTDELSLVGFTDDVEVSAVFDSSGCVWAHMGCAVWSEGVDQVDGRLQFVDRAVFNGLSQKCSYCRRYGASLTCRSPRCSKKYHFPCASAGGCFQDLKTLSLLCPEHTGQAEVIAGNDAFCIQCSYLGNVSEQLFCTSCGQHYHGDCLCPPVEVKPIVRAGWQCPNCKICQTCRQPGDDTKMLVCDTCDKGFHTFCLRPAMTTIPKNGWKCKNCRVCSDCGARTPGNGPSSRWHLNYSVCDSCYQQRNKGLCCPLCGKAYRHFQPKNTMVPCASCKKNVHSECDPAIDATLLQLVREGAAVDYICQVCRETDSAMELDPYGLPGPSGTDESLESFPLTKADSELSLRDNPVLTEASLTAVSSQDSVYFDDSNSSLDYDTDKTYTSHKERDELYGHGKLYSSRKKLGSSRSRSRGLSSEKRRHRPLSLSEKRRGPKIKIKTSPAPPVPSVSAPTTPVPDPQPTPSTPTRLDATTSVNSPPSSSEKKDKTDDDDDGDDHPATMILADSKNKFVMDQDVCKSCGSFGKGEESRLIVCTQCGQCYHPYCVSVKVTKVILKKGWRCLDCTVCEGCGGPDDEGRLLLCDDCDISYHTYCLDPPLLHVPKGTWKCKWCVRCLYCGATNPGVGCQWMSNYTKCGPCYSKIICPVCCRHYREDELIIQCVQCDRWLHCVCDGLRNEDEAEVAADYGYHCLFCRPRTGKPGPLPPPPPPVEEELKPPTPPLPPMLMEPLPMPEPPRQYLIDGVYLLATGMQQIQSQVVQLPKKTRQPRRFPGRGGMMRPMQRMFSTPSQDGEDSFDKDEDRLFEGLEPGEVPSAASNIPELLEEDTEKKKQKRRVTGCGIGGFMLRGMGRKMMMRRQASVDEHPDADNLGADGDSLSVPPKKPKGRRKFKKGKLEESFPTYLQDAFFGRDLMDSSRFTDLTSQDLLHSGSDSDTGHPSRASSPTPSLPSTPAVIPPAPEARVDGETKAAISESGLGDLGAGSIPRNLTPVAGSQHSSDVPDLDDGDMDILPSDVEEDLFNMYSEFESGLNKDKEEDLSEKGVEAHKVLPENLAQILGPNPNIDVDQMLSDALLDRDTVEDICKGMILKSDDEGHAHPGGSDHLPPGVPGPPHPMMSPQEGDIPGMPRHAQACRMPMKSPVMHAGPEMGPGGPPGHVPPLPPYGMHPQMGPQFGPGMGPGMAGPSQIPPWASPAVDDEDMIGGSSKRSILKWETDEALGPNATISAVLYVNLNFPNLKEEYPEWSERSKQIAKLWRKLKPDEKAPFLAKARKNRTSLRVQKAQKQVSQELKRRQEAQMIQDSEAMPPPPAPPPLPGHAGGDPFAQPPGPHDPPEDLSPSVPSPLHSPGGAGSSPFHRTWGDDPFHKPPLDPTSESYPQTGPHMRQGAGAQTHDTFPFSGPGGPKPDPYAMSPGTPRPRPTHPGQFGPAPSPSHSAMMDDPYSKQPMTPRIYGPSLASAGMHGRTKPDDHPSAHDPYAFPPSTPQSTASDDAFHPPMRPPLSSQDSFPGTPQPGMPSRPGSESGDVFHVMPQGADSYGQSSAHASPVHSMASTPPRPGQFGPSPGSGMASPLRHPDSSTFPPETGFKSPSQLQRSNSMPHGYGPQGGPPRMPMDPALSRSLSDVTPDALQHMHSGMMPPRDPAMASRRLKLVSPQGPRPWSSYSVVHPSVGIGAGEALGSSLGQGSPHQQLREILGQQTKLRLQKKDAERKMSMGPPPGHPLHQQWLQQQQQEGLGGMPPGMPPTSMMARMPGAVPSYREGSPGHPGMPDRWSMEARMVRPPNPAQFPPDARESFSPRGQFGEGQLRFPGPQRLPRPGGPGLPQIMSPGMQRPHMEGYPPGTPQDGAMAAEQRAQFLHMMQGQMSPGHIQPHGIRPHMATPGTSGPMASMPQEMMSPRPQLEHGQLPGHPGASTAQGPHAGMLPDLPRPSDDEVFQHLNAQQGSLMAGADSKQEDGAAEGGSTVEGASSVEGDALQFPSDKDLKPSISSEDDKPEDDDLLMADGTFDILKYADPELDLDDPNIMETLDLMDDPKASSGENEDKKDDEDDDDDKDNEKKEKEDDEAVKAEGLDADITGEDGSARPKDFQSQFLEFSQRRQQQMDTDGTGTQEGEGGDKDKDKSGVSHIAALLQGTKPISTRQGDGAKMGGTDPLAVTGAIQTMLQRPPFAQGPGGAQQSPPGQPLPGPSGLPSPKVSQSPRSGQPSPRTPGIQSPYSQMIGGRHSASPHSQPVTPGGQLSPFSQHGSGQSPFSPTMSSAQSPFGVAGTPVSTPQSPYPMQGPSRTMSPFTMPVNGSPVGTSQAGPLQHLPMPQQSPQQQLASRATITPTNQYNQGTYSQPLGAHGPPPRGGTLTPTPNSIVYGQSVATQHALRPQGPRPFPPGQELGGEGVEGMTEQQRASLAGMPPGLMQGRFPADNDSSTCATGPGMRPPTSSHPSLQQHLAQGQRPPFPLPPGQHRMMTPGLRAPGAAAALRLAGSQKEQHTLLDELLEQEKEEQKRQAEQQAMLGRREGQPEMIPGAPRPGMMPPQMPGMPPHGMGPRMGGPEGGWPAPPPGQGSPVDMPPGGPFPPGFGPRMPGQMGPHGPMPPFPPPTTSQQQAQTVIPPPPPQPPVPNAELAPSVEYDRQVLQYEDWLSKQSQYLEMHVKSLEQQIAKQKRAKKTIQARQRQARKNNQELNPKDTMELERVQSEQSELQKQLETHRKQFRQHQVVVQEYYNKQKEQYGQNWSMSMGIPRPPGPPGPPSTQLPPGVPASTAAPTSAAGPQMMQPRIPGSPSSIRMSPTARQEYDAYMQGRLRMAAQSPGARPRAPTTIQLGDNNPFSETFQAREQMMKMQQTGSQVPPVSPSDTPTQSPGAQTTTAPGPVPVSVTGPVPRPPGEGMAPMHFFRERPLEGGPRFRAPGPYGEGAPGPRGPTEGPRLPPYSGPGHPGYGMAGERLPYSQGIPMQPGFPHPGLGMPPGPGGDMGPGAPAEPPKKPKKRRKKKKAEDPDGAQSQPLPPSMPSQSVMGSGGQTEGRVSTAGLPKPPEFPIKPQSETDRRILEILSNTAALAGKESQNPPTKGNSGKGARSKSPAAATAPPPASKPVEGSGEGEQTGGAAGDVTKQQTSTPGGNVSSAPGVIASQQGEVKNTVSIGGVPPTALSSSGVQTAQSHPPTSETGTTTLPPGQMYSHPQHPHHQFPPRPGFVSQGLPRMMHPHGAMPPRSMPTSLAMQMGARHPGQPMMGGFPPGHPMARGPHGHPFHPGMGPGMHPQMGERLRLPPHMMQMPVSAAAAGMPPRPPHPGQPPSQQQQQQQLQQQQDAAAKISEAPVTSATGMTPGLADSSVKPGVPLAASTPQAQTTAPSSAVPPTPTTSTETQASAGVNTSAQPQAQPQTTSAAGGSVTAPSSAALATASTSTGPTEAKPQATEGSVVAQGSASAEADKEGDKAQSTKKVCDDGIHCGTDDEDDVKPLKKKCDDGIHCGTDDEEDVKPAKKKCDDGTHCGTDDEEDMKPLKKKCDDGIHCGTDDEDDVKPAKKKCDDGIHCGTDDEDDVKPPKKKCDDGIHCGTDDEEENVPLKKVCDDGIHCGTDDEDDVKQLKKKCDDGIHCGTDDEDDEKPARMKCDDGIHCGTDDEDDLKPPKKKCDDGIHCGTDDEDDVRPAKKKCDDGIHCGTDDEDDVKPVKKVCDDGIHCGTDDEEDKKPAKKKCDDGIHCGTDDEDDTKPAPQKCDDGIHCGTDDEDDTKPAPKKCDDGIHCGTDDEEDMKPAKKKCDDGIHCGTDDEDDAKPVKKVCDDGIHCGTDDEDEVKPTKKKCDDGIHCGTDDEEDTKPKKKVCDDGIHCGTDDEEDSKPGKKKCDDGVHCGTDDEEEQAVNATADQMGKANSSSQVTSSAATGTAGAVTGTTVTASSPPVSAQSAPMDTMPLTVPASSTPVQPKADPAPTQDSGGASGTPAQSSVTASQSAPLPVAGTVKLESHPPVTTPSPVPAPAAVTAELSTNTSSTAPSTSASVASASTSNSVAASPTTELPKGLQAKATPADRQKVSLPLSVSQSQTLAQIKPDPDRPAQNPVPQMTERQMVSSASPATQIQGSGVAATSSLSQTSGTSVPPSTTSTETTTMSISSNTVTSIAQTVPQTGLPTPSSASEAVVPSVAGTTALPSIKTEVQETVTGVNTSVPAGATLTQANAQAASRQPGHLPELKFGLSGSVPATTQAESVKQPVPTPADGSRPPGELSVAVGTSTPVTGVSAPVKEPMSVPVSMGATSQVNVSVQGAAGTTSTPVAQATSVSQEQVSSAAMTSVSGESVSTVPQTTAVATVPHSRPQLPPLSISGPTHYPAGHPLAGQPRPPLDMLAHVSNSALSSAGSTLPTSQPSPTSIAGPGDMGRGFPRHPLGPHPPMSQPHHPGMSSAPVSTSQHSPTMAYPGEGGYMARHPMFGGPAGMARFRAMGPEYPQRGMMSPPAMSPTSPSQRGQRPQFYGPEMMHHGMPPRSMGPHGPRPMMPPEMMGGTSSPTDPHMMPPHMSGMGNYPHPPHSQTNRPPFPMHPPHSSAAMEFPPRLHHPGISMAGPGMVGYPHRMSGPGHHSAPHSPSATSPHLQSSGPGFPKDPRMMSPEMMGPGGDARMAANLRMFAEQQRMGLQQPRHVRPPMSGPPGSAGYPPHQRPPPRHPMYSEEGGMDQFHPMHGHPRPSGPPSLPDSPQMAGPPGAMSPMGRPSFPEAVSLAPTSSMAPVMTSTAPGVASSTGMDVSKGLGITVNPPGTSGVALVKSEPREDFPFIGVDGRTREEIEQEQRAKHNALLKQLLSNQQALRAENQPPSTPDSEDSLPQLTPEQQRQLELIDMMPLCKETESSNDFTDWETKTIEEREQIIELRKQEYEKKRKQYEAARKVKRKGQGIGTSPDGTSQPKVKKRRKQPIPSVADPALLSATDLSVEAPVKRRRRRVKNQSTEYRELELEFMAETFLQQLHNLPSVALREPTITLTYSLVPIKGATTVTGESALKGTFGQGYIEGTPDHYGSLLVPPPPPPPPPAAIPPTQSSDIQKHFFGKKELQGAEGAHFSGRPEDMSPHISSPQQIPTRKEMFALPAHPRIEVKSEPLRDTPDTIISSSSPEVGFAEKEPDYPSLRPIDPASPGAVDDKYSPTVPLLHPIPIRLSTKSDMDVKPPVSVAQGPDAERLHPGAELSQKQDASNAAQVPEVPSKDLTVKLPSITSGLAHPFIDPTLDQKVSVTLTLSASAAEDIGGVISAIADLLKIAVPPTYEITRTPSPEMFKLNLTHKEEAINVQALMRSKHHLCGHCRVVLISSGIFKPKSELPPTLLSDDLNPGEEEVTFCSMNCMNQFLQIAYTIDDEDDASNISGATIVMDENEESKEGDETLKTEPQTGLESPLSKVSVSVTEALSISTASPALSASASATTQPGTPTTPTAGPSSWPSPLASPAHSHSMTSPGLRVGAMGSPVMSPPHSMLSPSLRAKEDRLGKRHRRSSSTASQEGYIYKPQVKRWRDVRWKRWDCSITLIKLPDTSTKELNEEEDIVTPELWESLSMAVHPSNLPEDTRLCALCHGLGDGEPDGPSRLLNMDVDKWVHLNCALWSYEVYETCNGALMNVDIAYRRGMTTECVACRKMGATLACFKNRCANSYHLPCARERGCMFFQDKTLLCASHLPKQFVENELISLEVLRRVYVNRDEDRQVASIVCSLIHQEDENKHLLRIGSLILHSIGQLLPHQIQTNRFNTRDYIFPVGFRTTRFYWSHRMIYQRCRYVCSIGENEGAPEFTIRVVEEGHDDVIFKDKSPKAVWMQVFRPLEEMRSDADMVKMFPEFMCMEELFGLTEPAIIKVLESLPGTDLLHNYNFKFGRSPLIEMPPAINPTGCARTEPKLRTHFKRRPHTVHGSNTRSLPSTVTGVTGDLNSPYMKQFVHSKSQQYRRLKTEWKNLVFLGRSHIQGLGLFAARDLEKHTMVIEYIGDLIRNEVANRREMEYENQNRGVYMFRIDNDTVVDATMAGGPARYINHSCSPNCAAEVVHFEKESKIIIITSRRISKGEELVYDYKFDFEDDQHKIPCLCGAPNCRKWMN